MKSRMLISVLVIALAAALIGGATMAWFTADASAPNAVFTAGTVVVDVTGGADVKNWNPGDCTDFRWTITNTGSKRVVFRVSAAGSWENGLNNNNITVSLCNSYQPYAPKGAGYFIGTDNAVWYLASEAEGGYFYFVGILDNGELRPLNAGESVDLCLKVCVNGPLTGNEYQGLTFTLTGSVEAIQSSNNAPNENWGINLYQ